MISILGVRRASTHEVVLSRGGLTADAIVRREREWNPVFVAKGSRNGGSPRRRERRAAIAGQVRPLD